MCHFEFSEMGLLFFKNNLWFSISNISKYARLLPHLLLGGTRIPQNLSESVCT